jgi:hypothetical protein
MCFWLCISVAHQKQLFCKPDRSGFVGLAGWKEKGCPQGFIRVTSWITDEISALLGYYAASKVNPLLTSCALKMGPILCPKTSVKDCHLTLRNTAGQRRSHQHRDRSLKSRILGKIVTLEDREGTMRMTFRYTLEKEVVRMAGVWTVLTISTNCRIWYLPCWVVSSNCYLSVRWLADSLIDFWLDICFLTSWLFSYALTPML